MRAGEEKKHTRKGNESRSFDHKKERKKKFAFKKERVEVDTITLVMIITT